MSADHNYIREYLWPEPRPATAFEGDYAFRPCAGNVLGIELCGTSVSHTTRLIFEPSEDVLHHDGEPTWDPRKRRYLPEYLVRFTSP